MNMRRSSRLILFIGVVQALLFAVHFLLYETWAAFLAPAGAGHARAALVLGALSLSFVGASLLARHSPHVLVRIFYTVSALWLGMGTFFLVAALLTWLFAAADALLRLHLEMHSVALVLFTLAVVATVYGIANAAHLRVRRVRVRLPNLPEKWRGRVAALISDVHLGHVRGVSFARRLATKLAQEKPDVIFFAGDLFDGMAADAQALAKPFAALAPPHGAYYVTGNHEEFTDHRPYLDALRSAGIRVLDNEKVTVDELQIVGVHFGESTNARLLASILQEAKLDPARASILLTHAPDRPHVAEEHGVSLQLSGHTHRGQFFPFTLLVRKVYREFAYGLQRLGNLLVYTSSGAGTWGPPLRVGTQSEIVLIELE